MGHRYLKEGIGGGSEAVCGTKEREGVSVRKSASDIIRTLDAEPGIADGRTSAPAREGRCNDDRAQASRASTQEATSARYVLAGAVADPRAPDVGEVDDPAAAAAAPAVVWVVPRLLTAAAVEN